ncbi:MAG: SH3 domain-containing protein [bacterium]|nr:SH3 domain-containing protein [bacterium]
MQPEGTVGLGTNVFLSGTSTCGTVRFEVNGNPRAEIGSTNQTETLRTNEFGTGSFDVCFVARGDGGWENAARFSINGNPFGESGQNTISAHWRADIYGSVRVCFHIAAGDWERGAQSCTNIEVVEAPQGNNPPAQGNTTDNQGGSGGEFPQAQQPSNNPPAPSNSGNSASGNNSSSANTSCGYQVGLSVGGSGQVTPGAPNRMRSNPNLGSNQVGSIPGGAEFAVVGGPTCADGYQWWQVDYNGIRGWTAAGGNGQLWVQTVSGSSGSSGSNSNSSSNTVSQPASNNSSCGVRVSLSVGGRARVTPGDPNRMRSQASTGSNQVGSIPGGGAFEVIGGPTCADGYQWWQVNYNGTRGWTAAGGNGQPWVQAVGGAGNSGANNNTGGVKRQITDERVNLADGSSFTFRFDRDRNWILNGSEFVVSEINKLNAQVNSTSSMTDQVRAVFTYAVPVVGQADSNIDRIKGQLCRGSASCEARILYVVSDRVMDLSGVGNIAYGYYIDSLNLPLRLSDSIANWDQLISSLRAREYITTRDNSDDLNQRDVGRELRRRGLSVDSLNSIAQELGLY